PAFWHGLIDRIAGAGGWAGAREITVLLGPAEEELRREFDDRALTRDIRVVSSPDMEALISLLGGASAYAGHDSGITHLSAMLGTPTVALFKGTDSRVWRPLGPAVQVLELIDGEGAVLQERVLKALRPYTGTACERGVNCES
ncbi:MAG: glycosyltransferase family 9 protein, partial [Desulfatiglandales bacterium]